MNVYKGTYGFTQATCLNAGVDRRPGNDNWGIDDMVRIPYELNIPKIRGSTFTYQNLDGELTMENAVINTPYYSGYVYCLEVPTHIFYVRRNGLPVWTGNSARHGQKGTIGILYISVIHSVCPAYINFSGGSYTYMHRHCPRTPPPPLFEHIV